MSVPLRDDGSDRARGVSPVLDLIAAGAGRVGRTCSCSAMSISAPAGEVIVVRVVGDVDLATVSCLRDALDGSLARGPADLVVDLAAMTFCDVRGLDLLARAGTTAADRGIGYAVASAPARACRLWPLFWPGEVPTQFSDAGAAVLVAMAQQVGDATARWAPRRGPAWVQRWPTPRSCMQEDAAGDVMRTPSPPTISDGADRQLERLQT